MGATSNVDQNHSVAWGVIVVMLVILAVSLVGLWMMATPIAGL